MIFEYADYRGWLRSELASRVDENPAFSGNAFAKKLGVSQSYLSLILGNRRPLTEKAALLIGEKLRLSELERQYLLLLIEQEKAKDPTMRNHLQKEMRKFRKKYQVDELSLANFKVIADWHYSAILELVNVNGFKHTISDIAKRLGVDSVIAKDAIERLLSLGLLMRKDGKWTRADSGYLSTPTEIASKALRIFHKQILQKAAVAIDEQEIKERVFSGLTMSIDPEKLPLAKEKIEDFKRELSELLETGNRTRVYQLSIQLFQLDNDLNKNEGNPDVSK